MRLRNALCTIYTLVNIKICSILSWFLTYSQNSPSDFKWNQILGIDHWWTLDCPAFLILWRYYGDQYTSVLMSESDWVRCNICFVQSNNQKEEIIHAWDLLYWNLIFIFWSVLFFQTFRDGFVSSGIQLRHEHWVSSSLSCLTINHVLVLLLIADLHIVV